MRRYIAVIVLNCSVFIFMGGVGMIVALLPQRIITLSGSISQVGYLASAFAVSYVLFQLPIGRLADLLGFTRFLIGGYLLCACTGVLYYFADTALTIFIGRILQGLGEAPIWALAPALLSLHYPADKGKMIGLYNASIHLGLTAGSLLGIQLSQIWQGNEAFLVFAGGSFLGGIGVLYFLENPCQASVGAKTLKVDYSQLSALITTREPLIVFVGILLYGAGYGIFLTMIPAFLIHVKQVGQTGIGLFFTLFYVAISLSQLIAGPFTDRMGSKFPMISGMLIAAMGIAAFAWFPQPWCYGLLTAASFGLGVFCVASMSFLNERVSNALKGTISGAFYVFWGIGFFLFPLVLGYINAKGKSVEGFWILSSLFFVEALILAYMQRKKVKEAIKIETSC
ncbi:quinolone resistance protein NorA-like protein [Candidatus Vecturithrix granuli]|uniref:Quinolone resistance protein NorA-like protein n=1 Tax=Vecturithrix granuli TaxID=1499967 RepID=A0A081BWN3_VECG1|nr:quinolone resistance protein NorA-like protein [Candidatus Vecturithrix granuli]